MNAVYDLLDRIQVSDLKYVMDHHEGSNLRFKKEFTTIIPEPQNHLETIVFGFAASALEKVKIDNMGFGIAVNKEKVNYWVENEIETFHKTLWMLVNKKKEWNRTLLSKSLRKVTEATILKETMFDLYMDAVEYGIEPRKLNEHTEIKQIHTFIASKFQAAVEKAACRR